MKISNVCAALAGACIVLPAWAGDAPATSKGVLGYLDPTTGAFRPARQAASAEPQAAAATAVTRYGVVEVTGTYYIHSATITGSTPIVCVATLSTYDYASEVDYSSIEEAASAKATVSGNKATCVVEIPYEWFLYSVTTDTVSVNVSVYAGLGTNTITGALAGSVRLSERGLPSIPVPADGATTLITYTLFL
jgi:hypothetical protein